MDYNCKITLYRQFKFWSNILIKGIDPTNDDAITAAATHYEDYGVANEDSGIGMPGGGMPSGMPSGSMPPLPSSSTTS